jgi:hypothetical protein
MKKLLFLFVFLSTVVSLYSQNDSSPERLMTKNYFDCSDISYNCQYLIPYYYYSGKIDSALLLNSYWNSKCGPNSNSNIAGLLLTIYNKNLNTDSIPESIFYDMVRYKIHYLPMGSYGKYPGVYITGSNEAVEDSFYIFMKDIATNLNLTRTDELNLTEYLLTDYFSGNFDSVFIKIQQPSAKDTRLRKIYDEGINQILDNPSLNMGIITGAWFPAGGKLKGFGALPEVGITIGTSRMDIGFSMLILFRFGRTNENYTIVNKNKTFTANKLIAGQMNFEFSKKLNFKKYSEFSIIGGLYVEGYNPPKSQVDLEGQGINSGGLTIGASYGLRPWSLDNVQFNIQMRYNQHLFDINKIDAPTGSSFSLVLSTALNTYSEMSKLLDFIKYQW